MTQDRAQAHCSFGTTIKIVFQAALYVPCGYMVLDHVVKGPLCFGLRKSFFHVRGKADYELACKMLQNDGRDVAKMSEIISKFPSSTTDQSAQAQQHATPHKAQPPPPPPGLLVPPGAPGAPPVPPKLPPPPRPQDQASPDLEEGMLVGILGLQSEPALNGTVGQVMGFDATSKRHRIQVEDGSVKNFKRCNLSLEGSRGHRRS